MKYDYTDITVIAREYKLPESPYQPRKLPARNDLKQKQRRSLTSSPYDASGRPAYNPPLIIR